MTGIFFASSVGTLNETLNEMNSRTKDWELKAARGECAWVCADCCCSFPEGMPDECMHGHQSCTDLIKRDKAVAANQALAGDSK